MPKYTVQLPDGRSLTAEAPTEQAAIEGAKKWHAANPKQQASIPPFTSDEQGEFDSTNPANAARLEAYNKRAAEDQAARLAEGKRRQKQLDSRNVLERTRDAFVFGLSMPIRAFSRGEYGLGDVFGLLNENAGATTKEAEQRFVEANQGTLEALKAAGDVTAGIPGINAMGAPARSVGPMLNTVRASPRASIAGAIRGTGETLDKYARPAGQVAGDGSAMALPVSAGRVGRGMQSYADNMQPAAPRASQAQAQPAPQSTLPQNIQTVPEKLADMQAFEDLGLKPFAPAFGSRGTARAARTIEELPGVGGTIGSPKMDVELGLKRIHGEIGDSLGKPATQEATGDMLQGALDRYRTKGFDELDPSVARGPVVGPQGPQQPIEPFQPVKAAERLTEGQAKNRTAAAPIRAAGGGGTAQTGRGVTVQAARPLEQIGRRRTNVEDLSDKELSRVVKRPSQETSLAARAEALYESAWRKLPKRMRKDETANPESTGWKNLQDTLRSINREVANQIGGQGTIGGDLAARIMKARTHTNIADLRSIRSEIGRALSNFGQYEQALDRTQLKRLYAAASRDMEQGLADIANRAWINTRAVGKDRVKIAAAKKADAALYEFRRADRYFRQGMARMEKVMTVLDAKNPNEAVRKIATGLKERTANPVMIRNIMGMLKPEEQNALRGHVLDSLGRGRAGGKMAEEGWNVNHWATDFAAMMESEGGKALMRGVAPEVMSKLQSFARVVNRMKRYESVKNKSESGYTMLSHPMAPGLAGAGGVGLVMFAPKVVATAAAFYGASGLMGKLMTSNAYLSWNKALLNAQMKYGNTAAGNARILKQYVGRLPALAKAQRDPDLVRAIQAIGEAAEQELEGLERQKARALPGPRR